MYKTTTPVSLYEEILGIIPEGLVYAKPVNGSDSIIDFQIFFSNAKAAEISGHAGGLAKGVWLKRDGVFSSEPKKIFESFLKVYQTGQSQELNFKNVFAGENFSATFSKVRDGVLCVFKNHAELQEAKEQTVFTNSIFESSPNGIYLLEAIRNNVGKIEDYIFLRANKRCTELTGVPIENVIGKRLLQSLSIINENGFFDNLTTTLETGLEQRQEVYAAHLDKWYDYIVVKQDADHAMVTFQDISQQRNTLLTVEQAGERLKAVFNASTSGMFSFRPVLNEGGEVIDFRFVITNSSFAAYIGQTPEVLKDEAGSTWFPGYLTNGVFDMYKHTYLTGETQRRDVHYNVDGHNLYLDLMSTKVGDEVLVTFTDYSALKHAQLQLEKNIVELSRSNANLEEFAYAASHDMKEPIRKVHYFIDSLKQSLAGRMNENESRIFSRMEVAAERMATLIDDLLEYSHISQGAHQLEEVDLSKKLHIVLSDLELVIQEKNAVISVGCLPQVTGHRSQLQQLFQNLISNALKYSKPGIAPQISVTATIKKGVATGLNLYPQNDDKLYHVITVKDNGIGFDQGDAERIFNVFQRLHGNHEYKGTGIGLSIVRKVLENHNGYIKAQGQRGVGSTFSVYLPVT